ncbi:Nramp family divalent metal transporter [Arenicella xantha]|uniref:NRAMP (Natural resistance-associated macrophage protein)-like metal ion transporter n=1 Tax=Arenicella xantha TaxID=644221 RepID=A0A395JMN2_9GAMM|nr:Nramp family divalent metal transporter [Arenicella xantha]RBP52727.1 NRAMP (natural resistance-associated macrophage protein)-like metal ion transporter [Arenicella xantha]
MLTQRLKQIGPGMLVAAAFIGPGTVTASTLAGANFGYVLLWALLFATLATMALQEMTARLGTVAQRGLGEALAEMLQHSWFKWPMTALVLVALYGGNAAYEGGNLAGATLGIEAVLGTDSNVKQFATIVLSLIAASVLLAGNYRTVERILIVLVLMMSLAFIVSFLVVRPDFSAMLSGLFSPSIPAGSLLTVIALIGTTVVPYNLFLHASAAKARWHSAAHLKHARTDTVVSIGLGGLVTILIVSTAAASMYQQALEVNSAADMAIQLEPLFGSASRILLGLGLFAAGLSSSITAPLATAYAVSEILSLGGKPSQTNFKAIALSVLLIGTGLALTGIKPIKLIMLAQFANGLILPIIAGFLLWSMNNKNILGKHVNGWKANTLGTVVIVVITLLGLRAIGRVFGLPW